MKKIRMAILGAGNIAGIMAATIKKMKQVDCYAVASRNGEKAKEFANKYGFKKAYGSYEEMLANKKIDLVYIATPHSHHMEHCKMCIDAGIPVLCEKSFTANASQAEEVLAYAKEKKILVTEAIWVRYMPMLVIIKDVLNSGVIGKVSMLTGNLGYDVDALPRITDPNLAGGALLDVGVYALNFASMIFGDNIKQVSSVCTYTETGVDEQDSMTLVYEDGRMAVLNASTVSVSDRKGIIHGDKGFAVIENINNFESLTVYNAEYKKIATYKRPKQITGYEYEVEACIEAIKNGNLECPQMPHTETIRMMKLMDSIREQWNIKYPFEV